MTRAFRLWSGSFREPLKRPRDTVTFRAGHTWTLRINDNGNFELGDSVVASNGNTKETLRVVEVDRETGTVTLA
jgi:hypothetical protein